MSRSCILGAVLYALVVTPPLSAQPPAPDKTDAGILRNVGVKNWNDKRGPGSIRYYGLVEKVEGGQVTLTCSHINDMKPKSRTIEAIKVLADGGFDQEC